MVMREDLDLFEEIRSLRQFTRVFHKQGKASEYSGGMGSLTPDEEKYLEAIQDAVDAQTNRAPQAPHEVTAG